MVTGAQTGLYQQLHVELLANVHTMNRLLFRWYISCCTLEGLKGVDVSPIVTQYFTCIPVNDMLLSYYNLDNNTCAMFF